MGESSAVAIRQIREIGSKSTYYVRYMCIIRLSLYVWLSLKLNDVLGNNASCDVGNNVLSSFFLKITINYWVLHKTKLIMMVIESMVRFYPQIFLSTWKTDFGNLKHVFCCRIWYDNIKFFSNYTWQGTLNPLLLQAMKNPAKYSPFGVNVEMGVYASKCGSLLSHIAFIYKESDVTRNSSIIM